MKVSNAEEFYTAIAEGTVLVDFYADWCVPCKRLEVALSTVLADYPSVSLVKVNVDEMSAIAALYDVMSVPTLVLLNDKKEVNRAVGATTRKQVKDLILGY